MKIKHATQRVTKDNVFGALEYLDKRYQDMIGTIDVDIVGGKLGGSEGPWRVAVSIAIADEATDPLGLVAEITQRIERIGRIPRDRIAVSIVGSRQVNHGT